MQVINDNPNSNLQRKGLILQNVQGYVNRGILLARLAWKTVYYSDTSPCQNMAQARFRVGALHKSKPMRDSCKTSWPLRQSLNEKFQALSNER